MNDHDDILFRAPEVIAALGGLNDNTVLEYISASPFYDKHCNNEVLKMQYKFNPSLMVGSITEHLKEMTGIEFVVLHSKPQLWVIAKQERQSPTQATILATYFVVNEDIYMSPPLKDILFSRLSNTLTSLNNAVSKSVEQWLESSEKVDVAVNSNDMIILKSIAMSLR